MSHEDLTFEEFQRRENAKDAKNLPKNKRKALRKYGLRRARLTKAKLQRVGKFKGAPQGA
ncbi:MAG: hypothetical protein ACPGOY_13900 [Rhodospirillaceae bacterium]